MQRNLKVCFIFFQLQGQKLLCTIYIKRTLGNFLFCFSIFIEEMFTEKNICIQSRQCKVKGNHDKMVRSNQTLLAQETHRTQRYTH